MAFRHFLALLLLLAGSLPAAAQRAQDVAGGRDHPAIGRYEGSVLMLHRARSYDELRIATAVLSREDVGRRNQALRDGNSIAVAGRAVRLRYEGPAGRSGLEVMANYRERLVREGFEVLFECRARDCVEGLPSGFWNAVIGAVEGPHGMTSNWNSLLYLAVRKPRPEGDIVAGILVQTMAHRDAVMPESLIDVVELRPMERDRIVFVDATAMERALTASGRIALYGISFDTDRAEPRAESRPTIEEIAKYLRSNPRVAVVVAGHTDSQGAFDYNLDLSRRRAQAVVGALTGEFGIPAARLTAFGAGMAAPVATNATEEGRGQNRRVEIVLR